MAKALAKETVERLAKLIPRLATEHDGEVIATVRAIHRTLGSAGADFHDLAAAVGVERIVYVNQGQAGSSTRPDHREDAPRYQYQQPKPPPRQPDPPPQTDDEKYARNIIRIVTTLIEGDYALTEREQEFLTSIRRQARNKWFDGLTVKQESWLATIIKKCLGVDFDDWTRV